MSKLFAALAVLATIFILALPAPASAAQRPDGVRNTDVATYEVSARRRYYRRHGYYRPYYRPYPYYGYYRPYYRPYPYYGYYGRPGFPFWW